ncbi:LysR family transcriptional regulator [Paenibacillus nanensis]|uniref:LysR family transcriptional regulator n=1 Tax=Paenibacillus nanensis TaxID=393251 RepID=A0A3A1UUG6_9BACL|nr:LysR family transcriptional regulator [Paenibacillus nanensis]RIX52188.1 LysR family transcriptional regulator [Paenibacillus nanensis]
MELYQLKTFIEVAQTGNLTEAAVKLHTSQPAASAHLKALESEVGFPLFYRTPKGMSLTEKGAKLLEESQKIIASIEGFRQIASDLRQDPVQSFRIGLNTDGELLRVSELVELMAERLPRVELHFLETKSEHFVADIQNNTISAGFYYGNQGSTSIHAIKLRTFRMAVVYPNTWNPPDEEAALDYFAGKPWVWTTQGCPFYKQSIDYFANRKVNPRKILYVDDEFLIGDLVQKEIGCSLLAEPIALRLAKENKVSMWSGLDLAIDLYFGFPKDKMADPIRQQIGNIIEGMWR